MKLFVSYSKAESPWYRQSIPNLYSQKRNSRYTSLKGCIYVCMAIMLLFTNNINAQLVSFVFNGLPGGSNNFGPSPFAATSNNTNLTIGGLTRGSGVGTGGTAAANGWGGTAFNQISSANAITNNTFVSFTVTPNTGYKVSFSDIPVYNVRRSNSGPPNGLWQYKVGAGAFTDIGSTINWGGGSSTGNDQPMISLSGIPALQNVPAGTTVTFRIVSWGGTNSSGTWYLYDPNNNRPLVVNGTVEPLCAVTGTAGTSGTCPGESNGSAVITLSGIGSGNSGVYSVDGGSMQIFTSNPFTVNGLAAGTHTLIATVDPLGCVSNQVVFFINQISPPVVSISGLSSQYCINSSTVSLTGSPSGGTFSGPGISGNTFNPAAAGIGGPYNITYSYTDPGTGCSNTVTQQVTVNVLPTVSITALSDTICAGNAASISLTFTGNGPWKYSINGGLITESENNPEVIPVNPTVTTTYEVTSLSDANCFASDWVSVAAGTNHVLAIKADGSLWSWGNNGSRQLGIGNVPDTNRPVRVGVSNDWVKISAGAAHSMALKTDGTLWAWGNNGFGRLGLGTASGLYNSPQQVGTETNWVKIDAGNLSSMALKSDGTLWGWGSNGGILGDGTNAQRNAPVQIGTDTDWAEVSLGVSHTLALKTNGTLWGWGAGGVGQLGGATPGNTPQQIGVQSDWATVNAGNENSMAIKTTGTLWGWGWNTNGELGLGNSFQTNIPTQVGITNNWQQISYNNIHTHGLKQDGTLWSWGENQNGSFGTGGTGSSNIPVQVGTATNWTKVSAGLRFGAGIKSDKTLWTWGINDMGQLGNGTLVDSFSPGKVYEVFSSVTITVNPLPVVSISGLSTYHCLNDAPVALTGTPGGGVFSGPGITGNTFDPVLAVVGGPYTVTYNYTDPVTGCSNSANKQVTVVPLPIVSFSGLGSQYCINAAPVTLTGNYINGSFSGPGIIGNVFYPSVAGAGGPYTITYTSMGDDPDAMCNNSISQTVTVHALPTVEISGNNFVCFGSTTLLTANASPGSGSISSYQWIRITVFDTTYLGTDATQTINSGGSYLVIVTNSFGCSDSSSLYSVTAYTEPALNFTGLSTQYCVNASPVIIAGNFVGNYEFSGNFSGPGITDNGNGTAIFNPAGAGGPYIIIYSYTIPYTSCTYFITKSVIVNALPIVSFSGLSTDYCVNAASVPLTGNPSGGVFSGPGITGNLFDPAMAGTGTHSIQYMYTDVNGCFNTATQQVTVNTCTPAFTTLNLTAFLEGFYSDINTMRANIFDLGISTNPLEADTVTVNLWSPASLSNTEPDHSVKSVLLTDGTSSMQFPSTVTGNSFYIAVKHRNHMETWSKLPVMFSSSTDYDFSDNLQKAYDDGVNPPMAAVAGNKFAIYGGDVNNDGAIDATDMADVDNDISGFAFGYNFTDVNGDGATDASDISILDNNQALFLFYARPY